MKPRDSRRGWLARVGAAAGGLGLAGCLGGSESAERSEPTEETTDSPEPAEQSTREPTASPAETSTSTPIHADYDTTEVRVISLDDEPLGSVTAAIADTPELRYLGLSDTVDLPEDRGMLFVYDAVDDRTFVMREMDFGIDIVYADSDGVVTEIHHAPAPGPDENGENQQYPGRGQYVLEVNYEWTVDRGVGVGDVLVLDSDG
jgi:uncharacterized membrane protein (UPF0127 family)